MHGLINRSIQLFITEAYGDLLWKRGAEMAGAPADGFEAMLHYDDELTEALLLSFSTMLDKTPEMLLEDLGTYLVSNSKFDALRRLMRFGGEDFVEFLHSLEELRDRARLALPDLDVPEMEVIDDGHRGFRLSCRWHVQGAGHLVIGVLRAMADDYGALVLLDYSGWDAEGRDTIHVDLLESRFTKGRTFRLASANSAEGTI